MYSILNRQSSIILNFKAEYITDLYVIELSDTRRKGWDVGCGMRDLLITIDEVRSKYDLGFGFYDL
jgi:hypothetical protein